MNATPTWELEAQRAALLRQLRQAGPMVEGSIAMVPRKCGSPSCPCASGEVRHQAMILCKKVDGRSVATYVPKALWDEVRQWNSEHRKIKRVLKDLSAINEQIVRNHVGDKRRAAASRKALKIAPTKKGGGR